MTTWSADIWWGLAPGLTVASYFLGGLILYTLRTFWVGGNYRDAEIESRGTSPFMGMFVRTYFVWLMRPVFFLVHKSGVPPSAITTLSFWCAASSGIGAAAGEFALAGWLYIFAGVCDYLDGRIARTTGRTTPEGGALDAILDRYADSAVLSGLAWFYRDSWVLIAVLFALAGSSLVPYIRAKGEALGVEIKNGVMQRGERIMYLGISMAFSPLVETIRDPSNRQPVHHLTILGILLLAVSTQFSAIQRFKLLLSSLRHEKHVEWRLALGRTAVVRNILCAVLATACDFVVMTLCVGATMSVPLATLVGCAVGGVINFGSNRVWTFASGEQKRFQMARYAFVSASSALLNAGGVIVLLWLPSWDYRIAWGLARVAVFLLWNYPLHRDYVFAPLEIRKLPFKTPSV